MKKIYAAIYNEEAFEGISVPFELKEIIEHLMNNEDEIIDSIYENIDEYHSFEVEYAHYAKDGSEGTTDIINVNEFQKWFNSRFKNRISSGRISEYSNNYINTLKEIKPKDFLSDDDAKDIINEVIDILIEKDLNDIADKLTNFRDNWLENVL
jgi:hypothetical protein